jgi:hypothetical protein
MLFDAHNHALHLLGGIPERGVYDNMTPAVDKVGRLNQRLVNGRFRAMVSLFLFDAAFCYPAADWEKGQVEKTVGHAGHRLLQDAPDFSNLTELNRGLDKRCTVLWSGVLHLEQNSRTVAEVFDNERSMLMAMPPASDGFVEHPKRVTPTCLVVSERNCYRAPAGPSLLHPRDRQWQLSPQELNYQQADKRKETWQNLSHSQVIRVAQFSLQTRVEILRKSPLLRLDVGGSDLGTLWMRVHPCSGVVAENRIWRQGIRQLCSQLGIQFCYSILRCRSRRPIGIT